jgi:pyruvate/2-oxoglutarate dehydrogenase complex dihydrolipoamide dehydrogenase (E3) component
LVKDFDPEVSEELAKVFRKRGVSVLTETRLLSVRKRGQLKEVRFERDGKKLAVAAEEILYALGRVPRLAGLDLPAAGVPVREGRIAVDAALRTRARHIFAAGDVAGPYEVVHIAIQQAETAARNAAALALGKRTRPARIDYRLKASVVFTDPEIASVGLTEREAREKGIAVLAAQYRFDDHGKSMIMGADDGFVKLVADRRGRLLGAQIIGPRASDLIHELIAVIHYHGTAAELAAMPHYHPTLAEIVTYPAEEIAEQAAVLARRKKGRKAKALLRHTHP